MLLGSYPKNPVLKLMSRRFFPLFPFRVFVVSGVMFKSIIHFELIFMTCKIVDQFHLSVSAIFICLFLINSVMKLVGSLSL